MYHVPNTICIKVSSQILKYHWTPYLLGAVFIIGVNIKEGAATVDIVQRVHHWIVRRRDDGHVLAKTIQGQLHILGPDHFQRPRLDRDAQDQESSEFL